MGKKANNSTHKQDKHSETFENDRHETGTQLDEENFLGAHK